MPDAARRRRPIGSSPTGRSGAANNTPADGRDPGEPADHMCRRCRDSDNGAPGGLWARTNNTTGVAARERPCSCAPPHATSIPGPLDLLPVAPSRRRHTKRRRGAVPASEPDLAVPAALARTRRPGSGTRVVRPRAQGSRTWATISISIPPIPRAVTWTVVRGGTPVAPTRRT